MMGRRSMAVASVLSFCVGWLTPNGEGAYDDRYKDTRTFELVNCIAAVHGQDGADTVISLYRKRVGEFRFRQFIKAFSDERARVTGKR